MARRRTARYHARLRDRAVAVLGGPLCQECGTSDRLEFAHVAPTSLKGRGRGTYHRLRDVVRNPENYRLLCRPCHMDLDYSGTDPWEPAPPDPNQLELDTLEEVPF